MVSSWFTKFVKNDNSPSQTITSSGLNKALTLHHLDANAQICARPEADTT